MTPPAVSRFVVLSTQRSGTSWFMDRLAAHPQVGGYGEILLRGVEGWSDWPSGAKDRPFYTTYLKDRGIHGTGVRSHPPLFRYLDYVYEPRRGFRAIGLKLMYDQVVRYPEILIYLRSRKVRILHLIRRNILDVYLSREALKQRNLAHARSAAERETVKLVVHIPELRRSLLRVRAEQLIATAVTRGLRVPILEVTYEGLLRDDGDLRAALAFLRVEDSYETDLPSVMLKLASPSHGEGIVNFAEVAAALSNSSFARFLRP